MKCVQPLFSDGVFFIIVSTAYNNKHYCVALQFNLLVWDKGNQFIGIVNPAMCKINNKIDLYNFPLPLENRSPSLINTKSHEMFASDYNNSIDDEVITTWYLPIRLVLNSLVWY